MVAGAHLGGVSELSGFFGLEKLVEVAFAAFLVADFADVEAEVLDFAEGAEAPEAPRC